MSNKRTLLIGINQYHPAIGALSGCVNDVTRIKQLLIDSYSFSTEEVRELTDHKATREAILESLDWLLEGTKAGDVLVLFYSGHGTRLPNSADPSGNDECLVAFSPIWKSLLAEKRDASILFREENWKLQFIRDKELKAYFDELPSGVNLTLVMDCCYSGDVNRDVRSFPRYIQPPQDIQNAIDEAQQTYWQQIQEDAPEPDLDAYKLSREHAKHLFQKVFLGNRFDFVNTEEKNILLAACSEKETALEKVINGKRGGIFTNELVDALSGKSGFFTYADLIEDLGQKMRFTPQMPRLACAEKHRQIQVFGSLAEQ